MADQSQKKFISDTYDKAQIVLQREQTNTLVVEVLKSYILIGDNLLQLLDGNTTSEVESSLYKKRYEKLRSENFQLENNFTKIKEKIIPAIAEEVKKIITESVSISQKSNDDETKKSMNKISEHAQNILKKFG